MMLVLNSPQMVGRLEGGCSSESEEGWSEDEGGSGAGAVRGSTVNSKFAGGGGNGGEICDTKILKEIPHNTRPPNQSAGRKGLIALAASRKSSEMHSI
jgi:hypothetical protein